MKKTLQKHLAGLENKVMASGLADGCKQTTTWCFRQLPDLYAKFQQTSESRYGMEITRLVQAVLKELANSQKTCPEALKLANGIIDRLKLLHEELGIPALNLKSLGALPPRPRKAS
jgi:hypothetical protein